MACSNATLQRNVNSNSTKTKSKSLFGAFAPASQKSFKSSLESSRKEVARPKFEKKDLGAKKDVRAKVVDAQKKQMTKLDSKDETKVVTDTAKQDLGDDEAAKELEAIKELVKEVSSDDDTMKSLTEEFIKGIAEMIAQFLNKEPKEVEKDLKDFLKDPSNQNFANTEQMLAKFVATEVLGDKHPLFSEGDELRLIKEAMAKIQSMLDELSESGDDVDFEAILAQMAGESEQTKSEQNLTSENSEAQTGLDTKEETPKIEVVDLRKDSKSSDNDLKGNSNFAEVLVKEEGAKIDGNFEVKSGAKVSTTEIIEQIVSKVKVVLEDGKSQIEMKLNPEHLGKVGIKLITENGSLKGTFTVENETVKHAIEQNLVILRQQLEESGIKIDKIEVALMGTGEENGFTDKENEQRQFNNGKNKNKASYSKMEEIGSFTSSDIEEDIVDDSLVNYSA